MIDVDRLHRELEAIVGPRRVSMRAVDLDTYARDMWPRLLLAIRDGAPPAHRPHAVVWPEHVREIVAVVRLARALGVPIVPYGGGSGVCGGAVPLHGGITIDTKRMQQVRAVHGEELICDVEAGLSGERFERELARRGYTFGHFPSSIYCSTVGGWLATRAAGQLSTKYGKVEDRVAGLTVVTGRGEVIETDGSVTRGRAMRGPSWTQLVCGSEGTLGIITSARLRVAPAPQLRVFRGFEIESIAAGVEAIRRVVQKGLRPAVVRLYDELDTLINSISHHDDRGESHDVRAPIPAIETGALPTWPDGAPPDHDSVLDRLRALARGKGLRQTAMNAALGRSELVNRVFGTVAEKIARRGCRLVIGLEGARIRTEVEAALAFAELEAAGARDQGEDPGWAWLRHRYAVSYRMSPIFRDGAFVDTMEVAASWERLLDLYHSVRAAIGRHAVVMAHFSHAYEDGCSIYFTFAGHAPDRAAAERLYDAIWRDGLEATTRVGATISHHHGVGLLKAPFMAAEHREAMAIFEAAKASLDPEGIMNPGKMGLRVSRTGNREPGAAHSKSPGPGSLLPGSRSPLIDAMRAAVGADHIEEVPDGIRVEPGSAAEVAEVVSRAAAAGAAIFPVGTGSRPARPAGERPRVLIATQRLDEVLQLDEQSLLVHAQAGITGLELERILQPRGLSIGDYPPSVLTSSLGGILAVRTPGKSSARHGFFEEAVVGVSAVLADGRTVHTRVAPRRSTGPDLARALCGSEGTIGVITSVVMRIHQRPESRLVASYVLPSIDAAVSAIYLALREEAAPSGLRIYDAAEAARHFAGAVLPAGHALLVAATAGPTDLAACDRDLITSAVVAEGGHEHDPALADLWWRRLHAGEPTPGAAPSLQVMATPSKLRAVYRGVLAEAQRLGASARAHISRFDPDGAVAFFTFDPDEPTIVAGGERAAQAAGGWLLGTRAHELDGYLRGLRDALDPDRVLNPGTLG
ncbi:MAG TPA: FAD-binding oxidoreductase [Kofleriaceae bacterium]|nr:FAD-binding oxidoreductase [Kofleriaceae bacterium]